MIDPHIIPAQSYIGDRFYLLLWYDGMLCFVPCRLFFGPPWVKKVAPEPSMAKAKRPTGMGRENGVPSADGEEW